MVKTQTAGAFHITPLPCVLPVLLAVWCSCSKQAPPPQPSRNTTEIYLVSHRWHSGIVVRNCDIPRDMWPEKEEFENCKFIEVGWGDKDYYMSEKATSGLALKAILFPTPSVLHVVCVDQSLKEFFPGSDIIKFKTDTETAKKISDYFISRFKRNENDSSFCLGEGLYGKSRFYLGREKFYFLKTCNKWTGLGLKSAGIPINTFFLITAGTLQRRALKYGKMISCEGQNSH